MWPSCHEIYRPGLNQPTRYTRFDPGLQGQYAPSPQQKQAGGPVSWDIYCSIEPVIEIFHPLGVLTNTRSDTPHVVSIPMTAVN